MEDALGLLPIPGEWLLQTGATGLLSLVVWLIIRGGLIPRRTYEKLEQDRDYWRLVAIKALGQTDALMPAAEITTKVAQGLFNATVERALSGTSDSTETKGS